MVYVLLSQLGNPSTLTSNTQRTSYDDNIDRLGNTEDIFSLIDGVFTPARATGFFTLQAILVNNEHYIKLTTVKPFSLIRTFLFCCFGK